ncbi:hypothetical protein EWM64_g8159 [Hericium alpestre]|uniref:Uncharacterized protein n=1 Tax=Hericium alpestre TaxID=135208 RepID=A0A4Y9ZMJ9_9AGAM|nr:hypothetical protein EWM64_g8159 [Hericium alpestre]
MLPDSLSGNDHVLKSWHLLGTYCHWDFVYSVTQEQDVQDTGFTMGKQNVQ